MLSFGVISFVVDGMSLIFVKLIDRFVYLLLGYIYNIYVALTKLDIFGATEEGRVMYEMFSSQIYKTIAIVMIFIFAYRLLMYIADPDGTYKSAVPTSKFIKGILYSVVMLIVAPTVFRYMSMFQFHVVSDGTITNIVLGESGGSNVINGGKQLSMITLMAFYHPYNTSYSDYVDADAWKVDENGNPKEITECSDIMIHGPSGDENWGNPEATDIRMKWASKMWDWCKDENAISPSIILNDDDIRKSIGDESEETGVEYFWIICTACGVGVIYFLLSYAIAVGTRAIRLGVLELVAPIPILLRMFGKDKYYAPWFNELKKTYLELFIRIAVIAFVIKLCTMVPIFIGMILG